MSKAIKVSKYSKRTGLILFSLFAIIVLAARVPYIGSYIDDYTFKLGFGFFRYFIYVGLFYFLTLKLINRTTKPWLKSRATPILIFLFGLVFLIAMIQGPTLTLSNNFSTLMHNFWHTYYPYITPTIHGYNVNPITGIFGTIFFGVMHLLPGAWGYIFGYAISIFILIIGVSSVVTCRMFYLYSYSVNACIFFFKKRKFENHLEKLSSEEKRKYPFFEKTQTIDIKKAITQELGLAPNIHKHVPKLFPNYAAANINKDRASKINFNDSSKDAVPSSPFSNAKQDNEAMLQSYQKSLSNKRNLPIPNPASGSSLKSKFSLFGSKHKNDGVKQITAEELEALKRKEKFDDEARIKPHGKMEKIDVDEVLQNMKISKIDVDKEYSHSYKYVSEDKEINQPEEESKNFDKQINETNNDFINEENNFDQNSADNVDNNENNYDSFENRQSDIEETDDVAPFNTESNKEITNDLFIEKELVENDFEEKNYNQSSENIAKSPSYLDSKDFSTEELMEVMAYKDLKFSKYSFPTTTILSEIKNQIQNDKDLKDYINIQIQTLVESFEELQIQLAYEGYIVGPSVLRVMFKPDFGVRVKDIKNVEEDIKRALKNIKLIIKAPIDGSDFIAVDIPLGSKYKRIVTFKETLQNINPDRVSGAIEVTLGKNLRGESLFLDIEKAPHVLVAGATGSGKSIAINTFIISILFKYKPEEVRLILIDPKRVEFSNYINVPHLMCPIIDNTEEAIIALKQLAKEMDLRYQLLQKSRSKNINIYNGKCKPDERIPKIVAIIDEYADLKTIGGEEIDKIIMRLTQLSRAAGIHMVLATQRPSVNIITGTIKTNIPTRIAFAVSSNTDSRTILDQSGAEDLLGNGDMLYSGYGALTLERIQGAFISDEDVNKVVDYVSNNNIQIFDSKFLELSAAVASSNVINNSSGQDDEYYDSCREFVLTNRRCSTSLLQQQFKLGYPRASRIVNALEAEGIVGPQQGSKPREVLK